MYCRIRKSYGLDYPGYVKIFRDYRWEQSGIDPMDGTFVGDPVERETGNKYTVQVVHSFRENGKVKKKYWHICTLPYWGIIDDWLFFIRTDGAGDFNRLMYSKHARAGVIRHFTRSPHFSEAEETVRSKLGAFIDGLTNAYRQTEEFRIYQDNVRVRADRERVEEEYREQQKRNQDEYRQKTWQDILKDTFADDGDIRIRLTAEQRPYAVKLIKHAFRKGCKEGEMKHPDHGGDHDEFIMFKEVYDKLMDAF